MASYLEAVFHRVHLEVTGALSVHSDLWLIKMLKDDGWWLRACRASRVCDKFGISFGEPAYYRDVFVWLPDVRWGREAMPVCPECESAERVMPHAFQNKHFGRRICGLDTHHFIMTRRYICHCCESKALRAKEEEARRVAVASGVRVQDIEKDDIGCC